MEICEVYNSSMGFWEKWTEKGFYKDGGTSKPGFRICREELGASEIWGVGSGFLWVFSS